METVWFGGPQDLALFETVGLRRRTHLVWELHSVEGTRTVEAGQSNKSNQIISKQLSPCNGLTTLHINEALTVNGRV